MTHTCKSRILPSSIDYPQNLPIVAKKDWIIRLLAEHRVIVIAGTTGSGKSTQIPKMCVEAGKGRKGFIGCTQPRRIAAIALAKQVGKELGARWQHIVGYKIRFDDTTTPDTVIKFLTDGMLLAEAQQDRFLKSYEVIIIDEAHERSLNIDILIGMLRQIIAAREDLTVIISSATIDPSKFADAFSESLGSEVPIVEIPSKLYPVEVIYRPWEDAGETEEWNYVDHAVDVVEELIKGEKQFPFRGDILVFMPTERDIRETVQKLGERDLSGTRVYPLYARQASWEQEKIFQPAGHRKIIIATNVAETSLTIPNVSFVVDTGLARISHYSPRTGIRALPVLPISRASADQRKGRCGRTGPGVCIRLYSEEDYLGRQEFTPPEIKRTNLSEVILRMLALEFEDVESFPFLDPPHRSAIREGFVTLRQLGAINDKNELTSLGRSMARFPLDPRLSRIIIEAKRRKALKEVLIIVSALNIQDPRKRPFGEEDYADKAHAIFADPRSDFLSLLNIWKTFQREVESGMSKTRQREWCRRHYLSYRVMREWISIYEELSGILEELEDPYYGKKRSQNLEEVENAVPDYKDIHCSLLTGFLCASGGMVAIHEGKGRYRGGRDRELFIFPGSFVKKNPSWIMAAEVVETSRVFARYVAEIEPQWVEEVGGHLCRYAYKDPHWDSKRGAVVASEKVTYQGLPVVEDRPVLYGRINPREAREIFIMEALVDGNLGTKYPFMVHNEKIIRELRDVEERVRRRGLVGDREALFKFYSSRLPDGIFDVRTFDRFMRGAWKINDQTAGRHFSGEKTVFSGSKKSRYGRYPMDDLLRITKEDILQESLSDDLEYNFPGHIDVLGTEFSLSYRFSPGSEDDGVTVVVPISSIEIIGKAYREGVLGWIVPGYFEDKVFHILKGLPKTLRREFVPIQDAVREIIKLIRPSRILPDKSFWSVLSDAIKALRGIEVTPGELASIDIPTHLVFRFEIVDSDGKVRAAGRNLEELLNSVPRNYRDDKWEEARRRFEIRGLKEFPEQPLPDRIEIVNEPSVGIVYAYPGLVDEGREVGVSVKLFKSPIEAQCATRKGLLRLYEEALKPVIGRYASSWVIPSDLHRAAFFMLSKEGMPALNEKLKQFVIADIFSVPEMVPVSAVIWSKVSDKIEFVKKHLFVLGRERLEAVISLIEKRKAVRNKIQKYLEKSSKGLSNLTVRERMEIVMKELNDIVPPDFLSVYSLGDIRTAIGLLFCLEERVDRCYSSPEKDKAKEDSVVSYIERYDRIRKYVESHPDDFEMKEMEKKYRWLLLGYKALVFTPEAFKRRFGSGVTRNYSARVLEEVWKECQKVRHGL